MSGSWCVGGTYSLGGDLSLAATQFVVSLACKILIRSNDSSSDCLKTAESGAFSGRFLLAFCFRTFQHGCIFHHATEKPEVDSSVGHLIQLIKT